ncbi:MAG: helicase [Cyanobium sp.]|uniref:DEAD/DEAH box helicase n=1 Tax=Synechococcus sp. CS-1333 TaxID=2848638 RepID=UPI000DBC1EF2|nr:DEAD/DEAH box helicase [Synechococcus sp. CS-1333]MCT0210295.1 DEAD/DEAH box helicase [Synechococcus sp. CS-1333]PZV23312.1 MAG: helicase [Cyanobium sp.]
MSAAVLAPGARIECRSAEWMVRSLGRSSDGQQVVDVVGVSAFLREKEARFIVEVEQAAGSFKVLQPEDTELVADPSPQYRDSLLFLEAHLRRTVPTDASLVVGHLAAMDVMDFQLQPAAKALAMPRQRLLIADAVGLGKTLECGILCSELIRRGRGKRILVVTTKSMLVQFQKEFWTRFSIPLVRLDSETIQKVRAKVSTSQNVFHYYDKTIVSIDTLKNDREYRYYLENASWDIIVIDECQNVAERAKGAQKSQRARLANRLATRSDTLILLSATPHDGKAESFASLMNMLDATAIANPSHYTKDDIKDLYLRRFRKDVIADLRKTVKERESRDVVCQASEREEQVFALLADLKLPDTDAKAKAGQLFRTTLAKSMLSSPMAALETVSNRLKRLRAGATPAPADIAALEPLEPLLVAIGAEDFSKYQRLLQLIRSDWSWQGKDPKDRLVIFTGRRESQRFLVEHLPQDLALPKGAVVQLDGAMADVEQTKVVEQFAQEKEAVRILVATEVASEGLNLHYLSHRLVHFDIPWSLMTLQQRNGRIDRYGQPQQPQIRYLLTASRNEGMGDTEKILRVLIKKDAQAQQNIGDPSVFLRVFDPAAEETEIEKAVEAGDASGLEARMDANAERYSKQASDDGLFNFDDLYGVDDGDTTDGNVIPDEPGPAVQCSRAFSLFPTLWSYVERSLEAVSEQMERRSEKLELKPYPAEERLELSPPKDLQRRYDRYPRELQPPSGQRLALSTDPLALQRALEQARRQDSARPELEYLWDLHPLVDWLADRGLITFARHQAPVLQLSEELPPGEVVIVLQGTIPNQRGVPVVQEWVAVRFTGSGLRVAAVEPFEDVAERLQLGRRSYANPGVAIADSIKQQRKVAVDAAHNYLLECRERWKQRMQPELEAQRQRLGRLRRRQVEQLELAYAADQRPRQIKDKKRTADQKAIEERFKDHERFVEEVMTIEPAPYLKLVAVLHREA